LKKTKKKKKKRRRENETHGLSSLTVSSAHVPGKVMRGCLGSNEFKQFWRIIRPTLHVFLRLLNKQFCHLSLSLFLSLESF
jgi:hypothetical protein